MFLHLSNEELALTHERTAYEHSHFEELTLDHERAACQIVNALFEELTLTHKKLPASIPWPFNEPEVS